MKKLFFITCSLVFISMALVISSCSKQELENDLATDVEKLSQASSRDKDGSVYEVEYILDYIKANKPIDWTKERDAKLLHSIGYYTDFSYIIGYKPKGFTDFENGLSLSELSNPTWKTAKENILSEFDFTKNDILQEPGDDLFPGILVESRSIETMERLMRMDELHYVEPQIDIFLLMFDEELQSAIGISNPNISSFNFLGCNCDQPSEPPLTDVKLIEPGMKMPWNYEFNGINEYAIGEQVDPGVTHAWNISTGQGIGVAVIDSVVSYEQENLDNFGAFDMVGGSFERNEYRENFLTVELGEEIVGISNSGNEIKVTREIPIQDNNRGAHDRCGHGTRMAGIIAGPRGVDGNSVGIAYNCNLYNYRATHNPLILTNREKIAVGRALIEAANEDGVNIVNMSIGQVPFAISSVIELGIDIAFGAGKMIVCAAGTSVPFPNLVVYPASSDKTVAVTGIKVPVNYPNSNQFILCNVCHGGEEVNYSIILQDNENNSRTTLAVTCDGDVPAYSSGTSSAAATFSGIAALVWSDLGTDASRSDVLQLISDTATPPNLQGEGTFGQGYINALEALEN